MCLMGCQDLLESVPGRTPATPTPAGTSEGKSMKVRPGLSGRGANGRMAKTDELSSECLHPCGLAACTHA